MMRIILMAFLVGGYYLSMGQVDSMMVRGFCIGAPGPEGVSAFADFIDEELGPAGVNTLVLRIDHGFEFQSRPELRDDNPLTQAHVDQLKAACARQGIRIIPQINLLGHQSWHSNLGRLLEVHPEFDETPHVALPEEYEWPNDDGLYCKSYCPLHPEVHDVVFDLVDEIMDAFDADAFHAGMDEVFYIADDKCPRCGGHDPAALFADEVRRIRDHLASSGRELWIWGDRLIDGKTTGIGLWEASLNNTHRAIDMMPTDVVICDWHYERAEPTYAYFALKGFRVITCPWRRPQVALDQLADWKSFKQHSQPATADRYLGMMQTIWSGAETYLERFEDTSTTGEADNLEGSILCFEALSDAWPRH